MLISFAVTAKLICDFVVFAYAKRRFSHDAAHILLFLMENWQKKSLPSIKNSKVPKFSYARKFCCNPPRVQMKWPNHRVFHQKDANGISKREDPDQTAPLGAV